MVEVYLCKLPHLLQQKELNFLLQGVSQQKKEKVSKLYHLSDKYRTTLGELLVRFLYERKHPSQPMCTFTQNAYGKPYIKENLSSCFFNISHSGEWVACAFHDREVGVDIEEIKDKQEDVAKIAFTSEEYERIMKEDKEYFYELWASKESYVKAVGKGFTISPDTISVKRNDEGATFVCEKERHKIQDFFCKIYDLEGYKLAVCAERTSKEEFLSPVVVSFAEILSFLT
ncbi:4'-phosphopantetheinyl transferase superfamily protein [Priestia filamentosa]|uniref:4'-phosphopantetheinyl transferase family protein n=1 Tax=Priestia filamentosa TaxID=1402861 RepID=UPI003978C86D